MSNIDPQTRETFKRLAKEYGLTKDDFHNHKHYVIIKRIGIEKIQTQQNIEVDFTLEYVDKDSAVVKAVGSGEGFIDTQTFGSANPGNCQAKYYVEMAEKRALSRVILKMTQFYQVPDLLSEDEANGMD